jgi:Ca-activated chloride channel homolog
MSFNADIGAVLMFLESVGPDLIPVPGTDIGSAIRTAINAFGQSGTGKAIVLITDGEDLLGGARSAADEAASKGIRIFPVGIGSEGGEPVVDVDEEGNVRGFKKDKKGEIVVSRLDVNLLNEIAKKTGGQAFFVTDRGTSLSNLMGAVALLPKSQIKHQSNYGYQEQFQIFIFLSLVCLLAEFLMTERKKDE